MFFLFNFSEKSLDFCPFLLMPAKKSIDAYANEPKRDAPLTPNQQLDSCCRSNYKCDVQKKLSLNGTRSSSRQNIRHCECEYQFIECMKNMTSPIDNEQKLLQYFSRMYSINTPQCYLRDYPIFECISFQYYFEPTAEYSVSPYKNSVKSIRCLEYKLDKSKPKTYHLRDLPFNYIGLDSDGLEMIQISGIFSEIDFIIANIRNFTADFENFLIEGLGTEVRQLVL